MAELRLRLPLSRAAVAELRAGQRVLLSGELLTARDAAHKRLWELLQAGQELPIALEGACIYYVGPSPAPPGRLIGSAGPTTSSRMDKYAPALIERGVIAMIGKGTRSPEVKEAMRRWGAVYFAATGGAAALLSRHIRASRVVAYPELGPEAMHAFEVEDFPVVVVIDTTGADLYEAGPLLYQHR